MISIKTIGAAALLLLPAASLAGPLVVRAAGPSATAYKPGQRLPDAPLVLAAGDTVTVLDAKGTRSFTGPGRFSFAAPSAAAAQPAFAALLVQKPERRARIGAVRGSGGETGTPVPPGIWAVDTGSSGTMCARDMAAISLWRADPQAAQTLTVTRAADGAVATLAFAPGQATAPLPATVAGAAGQLRITGGKAPVIITIRPVPSADDIESLGASFVSEGCTGQFARLADLTVQPQ